MSYVISFLLGVASTLTVEGVKWAAGNANRLKLMLATLIRREEDVRLSAAYLLRIKIRGKYLLIKGRRIESQLQPIGGVYKRLPSSASVLNALGVRPDDSLHTVSTDEDDLRVKLPRKNLLKFLDWFDSRTGREIDVFREFYEELAPLGLLSGHDRVDFRPEFVGSCERKLGYSTYCGIHEILVHDVFDVALSESVLNEIADYVASHEERVLFLVGEEDIMRESYFDGSSSRTIAPTAKSIVKA